MTVLTFLASFTLPGTARSLPNRMAEESALRPPAHGIRDESGFFSRNPEAMKRISDKLRKLEADHGYRVLLMVEPVLIGTTAPELAGQLQQSWLPGGDGLVVVFESDSRSLGFGRDVGSAPDENDVASRIPTHETAAILTRAGEATDHELSSEDYVESVVTNLVSGFDDYFTRRAAPLPTGRSMRLGLLTVGGLTLLGLGAIGIGALIRLPSMAGTRSFRFPEVDRPERLGAPCGGGNVTVRRFRK